MQQITDLEALMEIKAAGAVFILFGSRQCTVCHALRPRLETMLASHYPDITAVYVDCEASPEICAQHRIFSLPVVQFYLEGAVVSEFARAFSIEQLRQSMQRPYTLWHEYH